MVQKLIVKVMFFGCVFDQVGNVGYDEFIGIDIYYVQIGMQCGEGVICDFWLCI